MFPALAISNGGVDGRYLSAWLFSGVVPQTQQEMMAQSGYRLWKRVAKQLELGEKEVHLHPTSIVNAVVKNEHGFKCTSEAQLTVTELMSRLEASEDVMTTLAAHYADRVQHRISLAGGAPRTYLDLLRDDRIEKRLDEAGALFGLATSVVSTHPDLFPPGWNPINACRDLKAVWKSRECQHKVNKFKELVGGDGSVD
jgi:hypothetical protein